MSRLPPPQGVFSIKASCEIHAPLNDVYNILRDFNHYSDWNQFVPRIYFVDDKGNPLSSSEEIAVGKRMAMHVRMNREKGAALTVSRERATVVKHNEALGWKFDGSMMAWLLNSERIQLIYTKTNDQGTEVTVYETQGLFNGVLAWVVKWWYQETLQVGFEEVAQSLKAYAEDRVSRPAS